MKKLLQHTVPSSSGWHNERSAGSSSCCCPCKLTKSVPSLTTTPVHRHHDQGLNSARCITLCAGSDHWTITRKVCITNLVFLNPQQKSSCFDWHLIAMCLSTGKHALTKSKMDISKYVLFDVPSSPRLAGWSTVSPLSPYHW